MIGQLKTLVRSDLFTGVSCGEWLDVTASLVVVLLTISIWSTYRFSFRRSRTPSYSRLQNVQAGVLLGKPLMNAGYWALQPVGKALCRLNVQPDSITWFGLSLALGASVAVIARAPGIAGFLLLCSVLCDALDGMVARLTHRQSASGAVFDAMSDRLEEIAIFGSIAIAARHSMVTVTLCVLALVATLMNSYVSAKAEANRVAVPSGRMRRGERSAWVIAGLVACPLLELAHFHWRFYPPMAAIPVSLAVISIGTSISATRRAFALVRMLRLCVDAAIIDNESTRATAEPIGRDSPKAELMTWLLESPAHVGELFVGAVRRSSEPVTR